MIFRIPNDVEFQFRGNRSSMPRNLISAITARKMHRRGCQGYLAVVRDTKADKGVVENVPIGVSFLMFFLKNY